MQHLTAVTMGREPLSSQHRLQGFPPSSREAFALKIQCDLIHSPMLISSDDGKGKGGPRNTPPLI